eukprot:141016-Pyramimonas_sp.AAC.1
MRSEKLEATTTLTRLPSGHRMADVIRTLSEPTGVPAGALRRFPFLTPSSFEFKGGSPQQMTDTGTVQCYMLPLLLLIIWALRVTRVTQGMAHRRKGSQYCTASRRVSSYVGEILGTLRDGLTGLVDLLNWHLRPRAQLASDEQIRTRGIGERAKVLGPARRAPSVADFGSRSLGFLRFHRRRLVRRPQISRHPSHDSAGPHGAHPRGGSDPS